MLPVAQMGKRGVHRRSYRKFSGIMARISAYHSGPISIGQNLVTTYSNNKVLRRNNVLRRKRYTAFDEFIVSAKLREGPSQDQFGVWEDMGAARKVG